MAIPTQLRQLVAHRADYRCEYCLIHETYTMKKHEPDYIIPVKHGGLDIESNLAWACFLCNRHRGTDVAAYDLKTGQLTPIFNPRQDQWADHFQVESGLLIPNSAIGRVTILVLRINLLERVELRAALTKAQLYPDVAL